MDSLIIKSILDKSGQTDLFEILTSRLSGTALNSLLLEVFKAKCEETTPGQLMRNYQKNRFVKPSDLPVLPLRELELDLLKLFDAAGFTPIELSPVSVMGSCSVVGLASQHKVLTALRGTEVLADATNALALHASDLVSRGGSLDTFRFSTIQRHLRTQTIAGKGFTPHFKIACLVTAGVDQGSYSFEKMHLAEHIHLMKRLYLEYYKVEAIRFRFICRDGYKDSPALANTVRDHVLSTIPGTDIEIIANPKNQNGYYKGIQYKIDIDINGRTFEIGDGGFVDWTQQLCQNKKARMLSTGIGIEFMFRIVNNMI